MICLTDGQIWEATCRRPRTRVRGSRARPRSRARTPSSSRGRARRSSSSHSQQPQNAGQPWQQEPAQQPWQESPQQSWQQPGQGQRYGEQASNGHQPRPEQSGQPRPEQGQPRVGRAAVVRPAALVHPAADRAGRRELAVRRGHGAASPQNPYTQQAAGQPGQHPAQAARTARSRAVSPATAIRRPEHSPVATPASPITAIPRRRPATASPTARRRARGRFPGCRRTRAGASGPSRG